MLARYKKILISLFTKVHELRMEPLAKRMLALEIQEELLLRLVASERIVRKTKKALNNLKTQLRSRGNTKQVSEQIKKSIERLNANLDRQKYLMWCLRTVGDAIAFIYADKWEIKNYAFKQDAGFISGKAGTRLERGILRSGFKLGGTFVLNDLTNSLRHADITMFRAELWPEGNSPMIFIEAKSGKGGNKERAERQKKNIEEISQYITTDTKTLENGSWHRIEAKRESQHHFQTVENLIKRLSNERKIIQEVETGLYYILLDTRLPESDLTDLLAPIFSMIPNAFMLSVNDVKEQSLGYFPFTLSFVEPNSLFRFYNGEFLFMIIVDIESVNKRIANHKLKIHLTQDDSHPMQVISQIPIKDYDGSYVGFHIIGRLAAEFLRLDWFIENVILMEKELLSLVLKNSSST
jgi:hypothetical protein